MNDHISYFFVVATTILLGSMGDYANCRRDWCGIRLLPGLLLGRIPAISLVTLMYLHFIHVIDLPFLRQFGHYSPLFYIGAAFGSEYLSKQLLRGSVSSAGLPLILGRVITREKIELADRLLSNTEGNKILIDAIVTCDELSHSTRKLRVKALNSPPTRIQILETTKVVGLGHISTVLLAHLKSKTKNK